MHINTLTAEPITREQVLEILNDDLRHDSYFMLDEEDDKRLHFDTPVDDWREVADLLDWRELAEALNEYWRIDVPEDRWKATLEPAKKKNLWHVCDLIAEHATIEVVRTPSLMGRPCRPAGMFFAIKELLARDGADVSRLIPSTPITQFSIDHLDVFVSRISPLVPGRLPKMKYDHPSDTIIIPLLISYGFMVVSIGISWWVPYLWIVFLAVFAAMYCIMQTVAGMKPTNVSFGDLTTFRDLANLLASDSSGK